MLIDAKMLENFEIELDIAEAFGAFLADSALKTAAQMVLLAEGLEGQALSLTIVIAEDEEVRRLNQQYRGIDRTTDVLSFANEDAPDFVLPPEMLAQQSAERYLGDIIIAYPQAERQAVEFDHSTQREVQELIIHGVFHLLGYDHETPDEREVMRAKEEAAARLLDEA
jgi:probable rRNA maturation factor